jgi:hypothetical protein
MNIEEILETYPDLTADALARFKTASVEKERIYSKSYLEIKARTAGEKITVGEIDALIKTSAEWYSAAMEEIKAESEWTRCTERLMAAKKQAAFRTAF